MKAKKILTNMLCASMVVSNITPVFATVTNDTLSFEDTDTSALEETEVLYERAGSYFVTIPKTISLGADKQSKYFVKVEGDIPSDRQVYVSPIDGIKDTENFDFYMHDTNTSNPKDDVVATVTQSKFYWNFDEVANGYEETDNQVTALDLTSGTWKGTFDFEINMHKIDTGIENPEPDFTLTTDGDVTLSAGEIHQLNAYIDGIESNSDVIWSCDNDEVTINNGLIELPSDLEAGSELTITVSKDGKETSFIITVNEAAPDFELTTDGDVTLSVGEAHQLNAYIDGIESNSDVVWMCDNPDVAINDGLIEIPSTLQAGSKITITVLKDGKELSFTITIEEDVKQYVAGLYDANDTLLVSWEDSGIDDTCSNARDIIINTYPNTTKVVMSDSVSTISKGQELVVVDGRRLYTYKSFYGCTSLKEIIIPDSVINIGSSAFSDCTSLTSINIPKSITTIESSAFCNCTSLTNINIPESITSIGNYAFIECTSLTNINIPESLTTIKEGAFYNCKSLADLQVPDSVVSIGSSAFYKVPHITYNGTYSSGKPWGALSIN